MTDTGLSSEDLAKRENLHLINEAVARSKNEKLKEDSLLQPRLKVGEAPVYVGGRWDNRSAVDHPKTIYVYSDNLQSRNDASETPVEVAGLEDLTD